MFMRYANYDFVMFNICYVINFMSKMVIVVICLYDSCMEEMCRNKFVMLFKCMHYVEHNEENVSC